MSLKHTTIVRGKIEKANDVVKYVSTVPRGPEINTALILYKSLVRSTADYASYVYFPDNNLNLCTKLERGQLIGLRTAMGYRNSTPTNVIIAEAKVTLLRHRALKLAKYFCTKIFKYGSEDLRNSLEDLQRCEHYQRYKNPKKKHSIDILEQNKGARK